VVALSSTAQAQILEISVPAGDLSVGLQEFIRQSGSRLLYRSVQLQGINTRGVSGRYSADEAIEELLRGTGFTVEKDTSGIFVIVPQSTAKPLVQRTAVASLAPAEPEPSRLPIAQQDNAGLEEIVVTARRRAESLQRTPVSIKAFTSNDLYVQSITRAADLQYVTPGLQVGFGGIKTNPTLAMRGQRRSTIGDGAPAVLVYQNEVPLPALGSLIPTYDMSSVQVLKGPQGTLFGRNATAGAVLLYTTQPGYQREGYADVRFGNYNDREVEGALNLPIAADKAAIRVAGQLARRDGYTKNLGTGPDLDDRHDQSVRVSLLLQPIEELKNVTVFDYQDTNEAGSGQVLYALYPNATSGGGNARIPALAPFFDCGTSVNCDVDLQLAQQQANGPRDIFVNTPSYLKSKLKGVVNTTSWDINDQLTLKNIFGYRSVDIDYLADFDGTPLRLVENSQLIRSEQLTDELQASGKLLDSKLDWIVGGFYLDDHPDGVNSQALAVLSPSAAAPFNSQIYRRTKSKALYGQIGYDLSALLSGLKFNLGGRRTKDDLSVCSTGVAGGLTLRSEDQCSALGQSIKSGFNATTWTVGLDWQVSRDVFLYATSRKGYRAGGLNAPVLGAALAPLQNFSPETITDGEIGVKASGSISDMPYRLGIAAYRGWYKDIQRNYTLPPNFDGDGNPANDPGQGLVLNSGDAILQGAEFDAMLRPFTDLTLSISGAYTDAYYRKLQVTPSLQAAGLIPANAIDSKFPYVPTWTYGAAIEYNRPLDTLGNLLLRADYYHSDSYYLNERPAADVAVRVAKYDLVNARVGLLEIGQSGVDVNLFVNNLFDKTYVAGSGVFAPALTFVSAIYGAPRTYGIQLRYRFGE
jgi:iron complex outermembrane receptor protein